MRTAMELDNVLDLKYRERLDDREHNWLIVTLRDGHVLELSPDLVEAIKESRPADEPVYNPDDDPANDSAQGKGLTWRRAYALGWKEGQAQAQKGRQKP